MPTRHYLLRHYVLWHQMNAKAALLITALCTTGPNECQGGAGWTRRWPHLQLSSHVVKSFIRAFRPLLNSLRHRIRKTGAPGRVDGCGDCSHYVNDCLLLLLKAAGCSA